MGDRQYYNPAGDWAYRQGRGSYGRGGAPTGGQFGSPTRGASPAYTPPTTPPPSGGSGSGGGRRGRIIRLRFKTNITGNAFSSSLDNFPRTHRAIQRALAGVIRPVWLGAVNGSVPLPGARLITNREYADSLMASDAIQFPLSSSVNIISGAVVSRYRYGRDVETGFAAFDMKPGMLKGPKVKMGKHGRYLIVPFRWRTPGGSGRAGGFASVMDKPLHKAASKLHALDEYGNNLSLTQRALDDVDAKHGTAWGIPRVAGNSKHPRAYRHHSALPVRMEKKGAPRHRQYMTFRTVSDRSDPRSWWHPGLPPNPIVAAASAHTLPIVERMIAEAIAADIAAMIS